MPSTVKTARNYIVCYSTPLVAEDISSGITEWDPEAVVEVCSDPGELFALLEGTSRVFAVFASQPPAELVRSGLLTALRAKGGQLIWLASRADVEAAEAHPSIVALDVPFTTETLHEVLRSLKRS
ncbi:MAG: hypothetical protein ACLFTP_00360 [Rhodosalinus sp.]|uniref:hypothetical protein n=1 Tax=Rhodosalinus sp. TaxID=2047741 RepID=UPI003978285A